MRALFTHSFFILILLSVSAQADTTFPAPSDTLPIFTTVGRETSFVRGSVLEGAAVFPLDGVLRAVGTPYSTQDSGRRYMIEFDSYYARLATQNHFVVLTDRRSGSASLLQLPDMPRVVAGSVYIPSSALSELLDRSQAGTVQSLSAGSIRLVDTAGAHITYDITGLSVESRLNGYLMTINASRKLGSVESWLKPDGWLFITAEGARADTLAIARSRLTGAIRQVLVFQSPTSVQLTFKVAPDVEAAEVVEVPGSNDLFVTLRTRSALERQDLDKKRLEIAEKNRAEERKRWSLDVVVIDPGHGGKDPGTVSLSGAYEKDIALSIGLKLGELIRKNLPGVKVVYTRTTDKFVELYKRSQIANEAGGKLFICIHCNSMPKKPSPRNGFEIYLLRPGRTDDAIDIAARENSVIQFEDDRDRYKELTEEEFILVTMAQSAYFRYSEEFAQVAVEAMDKHTTLKNGGVKQAGFYVLVGASMPNVYVETGFLSNKKDEAYLKSNAGRQNIAKALFEGVKSFKDSYEKELNEGLGALFGTPRHPPFTPLDATHR